MYLGFYIGHKHFFRHAEMLIKSVNDNMNDIEVIVIINSEFEMDFLDSDICHSCKYLLTETDNKLPFVDKLYAGKVFEEFLKGQAYIWVDVDSFFLRPLDSELMKKDIHINPVDKKNIGVLYKEEPVILLKMIYDYLGMDIRDTRPVRTTTTEELIYPYYNIGFVLSNKNKNVFHKTIDTLEDLLGNDTIIKLIDENYLNAIFIHQLVFSAVTIREYGNNGIGNLPAGVNYPLHLRNDVSDCNLTEVISFRYDDYFNREIVDDDIPIELKKISNELKMIWYYQIL